MSETYTPTLTRADDGSITLNWPADAPRRCEVDREVLVEIVEQLNQLNAIKRVLGVTA